MSSDGQLPTTLVLNYIRKTEVTVVPSSEVIRSRDPKYGSSGRLCMNSYHVSRTPLSV